MRQSHGCLLVGAAVLLLGSGCGPGYLPDYTARGPSAQPGVFLSLAYWPNKHMVVERLTEKDCTAFYSEEVDFLRRERPGQPAFRSLCAVLNTHFDGWERLVVIERLGYREDLWYGYVVLGVTPRGTRAVTNMAANDDSPWDWQGQLEARRLCISREQAELVLEDLDRMEKFTEMTGLIWFDARDWPMYVLHDVRAGGRELSFGIRGCGAPGRNWTETKVAGYFMGWEEASNLVAKYQRPESECVPYASPRASELKKVGASYATLMAIVWKRIMGLEDAGILGHDHEVALTE